MFSCLLIGSLVLFILGVILLLNDKDGKAGACIAISVVGLVISLSFAGDAYYYNTEETTKELKLEHIQQRSKNGTIYYLYDFDQGTRLCNKDGLYIFKFNSGDIEMQLREGKTYKVTYKGKRSHFWSWYPNITDIEEIK